VPRETPRTPAARAALSVALFFTAPMLLYAASRSARLIVPHSIMLSPSDTNP
jgi:hypothetical protein